MNLDYLFITSNTIKQGISQRKFEGVESGSLDTLQGLHYKTPRICGEKFNSRRTLSDVTALT